MDVGVRLRPARQPATALGPWGLPQSQLPTRAGKAWLELTGHWLGNWLETARTFSVTGVCGLRANRERFLRAPEAQVKHPVGQSSTVRAETLASWLPPSRVTTFTVNPIGLQQL